MQLYTIQSLLLALALPTCLSGGHSESSSRWILKLCYFVASQLGFLFILAMHVINGKVFCCLHKMKPVHMALAIRQILLFCGSGDNNQGSSCFVSSFSLGPSRLLGVDVVKGKQE